MLFFYYGMLSSQSIASIFEIVTDGGTNGQTYFCIELRYAQLKYCAKETKENITQIHFSVIDVTGGCPRPTKRAKELSSAVLFERLTCVIEKVLDQHFIYESFIRNTYMLFLPELSYPAVDGAAGPGTGED